MSYAKTRLGRNIPAFVQGLGYPPAFVQGLGQAKGTTTAGKTGTSTQPDRTAQDWSTGLQTAGTVAASLISAATGQQPAAATTETPVDPSTYLAPAPASPGWYWPVVIGVGVAVLGGIGYLSYTAKAPVKANRRRMRRNSKRRRSGGQILGTWHHKFDAKDALRKHGGRGRIVRSRGPYAGSLDKYTVYVR